MTISSIMGFLQQALLVAVKVSMPVLLVSMAVGLIISIFQAATQIHEQTMTFVPKLIAIAVILIALGAWMTETLMDFMKQVFQMITTLN